MIQAEDGIKMGVSRATESLLEGNSASGLKSLLGVFPSEAEDGQGWVEALFFHLDTVEHSLDDHGSIDADFASPAKMRSSVHS